MYKPCCREKTTRCRSCFSGLKLKFAGNIHFKQLSFEIQASELQTYRRKTEFNAKWTFSVIQGHSCFGVSRKAIRE